MIDIQLIRKDPEAVKQAIASLGTEAPIDEIVELDRRRREILQKLESLRQERNQNSEKIGRMEAGDERQALIDAMGGVNEGIKELETDLRGNDDELQGMMFQVPNLPHASVPIGADESENAVLKEEGMPPEPDFEQQPHWDLGPQLGILDFERGVKLSGSRFYVLMGAEPEPGFSGR